MIRQYARYKIKGKVVYLADCCLFGRTIKDEFEANVHLRFNNLAVFQIFHRIILQDLLLLVRIVEVATIFASESLTNVSSDPLCTTKKAFHRFDDGLYVGNNLDSGRTTTDYGDSLIREVDRVIPIGGMQH